MHIHASFATPSRVILKKYKTRPSALLSYISMWKFLRTLEKCIEKNEAQPSSRVFLKIPKVLIYLNNARGASILFVL